MDEIDVGILNCLKKNARMNASAISAKINLSVSAVIERIKKLESSGIISSYTVILDNEKIGRGTSAFLSVSLEHPKFNEEFIKRVKLNSDIIECHYITGDFDFMLKVVTDSTKTLTAVLDDIKRIPGVSLTRTLLVLDSHKMEYTMMPK